MSIASSSKWSFERMLFGVGSWLGGTFGVDPQQRIQFYVEQGLVQKAPNAEQLRWASAIALRGAGVAGRIGHFIRRPLDLFPSKAKRACYERTNADISEAGFVGLAQMKTASLEKEVSTSDEPRLEKVFRSMFLFSPAKFAVQCVINPWTMVPTSGLDIPPRFVVEHILHTAHAPPGIWDLQLIHPDPGALDALERKVEVCRKGGGLGVSLNRALGSRRDQFDFLADLIPRVRAFEYPPMPDGLQEIPNNLVAFLRFAAELDGPVDILPES